MDALFSSLLIYACEQLKHLKEGMHGLMNMSAGENNIYPGEAFVPVNDTNLEGKTLFLRCILFELLIFANSFFYVELT